MTTNPDLDLAIGTTVPSTPSPTSSPELHTTPPATVTIDVTVVEKWLGHTGSLPVEVAAAIAESLTPADGACEGTIVGGRSAIAGRGLFAAAAFGEGALITVCPLLQIPGALMDAFAETTVYGHCFDLGDDLFGYPVGLVTLLNHSSSPTARCELDADAAELWVYAAAPITPGNELTIDYTGGDTDHDLWFDH